MILPLQRVTRYPLLLRELLSKTPSFMHEEIVLLEHCIDEARELSAYVDVRQGELENSQATLDSLRRISGLPIHDIFSPSSTTLFEGGK